MVLPVIIRAAYDDEASIWYVESSTIEGLRTEANTLEALTAKLPGLVVDLIEANSLDIHGNVPIELIAHAHALAYA
jgi:hypothetical protein